MCLTGRASEAYRTGILRDPESILPSDRDEAAIQESPEAVAAEMNDATERLRDQAWMIAPLTKAPIEPTAADHPAEAEPLG